MKTSKKFLLLAIFSATVSFSNFSPVSAELPPPPPGVELGGGIGAPEPINTQGVKKFFLDIPYASQSDAQKLDIYLPNEGNGPFPVILAVHGGGFQMGDKNSGEINPELTGLTRGYAVVAVNYRLSGEAPFPAAVYDVKSAVRFIKAHAKEYNLNPNKIAAWGDSAGGNLVSMLGTSAGHPELEDFSTGNANESSTVTCVVDWFGPTDFYTMDKLFKESGKKSFQEHDAADSAESLYMGVQVSKIPNLTKFANPESYISKNTVPFFIENGSEDPIVPTQQSKIFYDKLKAVIGEKNVTYILIEGGSHGGSLFETKENLEKVFAFLDKRMKK